MGDTSQNSFYIGQLLSSSAKNDANLAGGAAFTLLIKPALGLFYFFEDINPKNP